MFLNFLSFINVINLVMISYRLNFLISLNILFFFSVNGIYGCLFLYFSNIFQYFLFWYLPSFCIFRLYLSVRLQFLLYMFLVIIINFNLFCLIWQRFKLLRTLSTVLCYAALLSLLTNIFEFIARETCQNFLFVI